MPTLMLHTNVPANPVEDSDTLKLLSAELAAITGKPESFVCVVLKGDTPMCFAGTEEPCAYGELVVVERGPDPSEAVKSALPNNGAQHHNISEGLSGVLQQRLGVSPHRFYLQFSRPAPTDMGFRGTTFT